MSDCISREEVVKDVPSPWISVKDKLPDNNDPVIVTFVNRDPVPYYEHIKDVPFTAAAHYHHGEWWWFSVSCQCFLDEYGISFGDEMSKSIEITAWMPMPDPYKEVQNGREVF